MQHAVCYEKRSSLIENPQPIAKIRNSSRFREIRVA